MAESDRLKWDAIYRNHRIVADEPHPMLLGLEKTLPRHGRAIDVAGGSGRNAIWLARRGLDVVLADISREALAIAERAAGNVSLRGSLRTLAIDLEAEPFPTGPWDLALICDFLHRPLFDAIPMHLAPGGMLLVAHPTRTNLMRHPRPGPRFLLDEGELPRLVPGLEVRFHEERWWPEGRHEARMVAVRPRPRPDLPEPRD